MTDHHAFLQTILAEPDADTPRLVYADWLEEQGDAERAEFIRVQCELAHFSRRDPRRKPLVHREIDLLFHHYRHWRTGLPSYQRLVWRHFERGCMAAIQVHGAGFLRRQAAELFQAAPVQTLHFFECSDDEAGILAQVSQMQRIRRLSIRSHDLTWRGFRLLAESPHVTGLIRLQLPRADDTMLQIMAQSPHFTGLRHLSMEWGPITKRGLRILAESPYLEVLRELSLPYSELDGEGIQLLIEAPVFRQLELIQLPSGCLQDEARVALQQRFGDALLMR